MAIIKAKHDDWEGAAIWGLLGLGFSAEATHDLWTPKVRGALEKIKSRK